VISDNLFLIFYHFSLITYYLSLTPLFYLALLIFLLIPIGYGFALAVYLKREYANLSPPSDTGDPPSSAANVFDFIDASGVAQDILLAKNKDSEEETAPTPSEEKKVADSLASNSVPPSPEQASEPQSDATFDHVNVLERAMNTLYGVPSEKTDSLTSQTDESKPASDEPREETVAKESKPEIFDLNFDFDALKNILTDPHEETVVKESEPEILDHNFGFDALKNILTEPSRETVVQEPEPEPEILGQDFDFEALINTHAEPGEKTVLEPEEEPQIETIPKITKETFANIPVYGSVPEDLLETHLCMDQELSPDTMKEKVFEIRDSFPLAPDSLFHIFQVDSPSNAEHFVQTEDVSIAFRSRKKRIEGRG